MEKSYLAHSIKSEERKRKEDDEENDKIRQPGVSRPAASAQKHLLIIKAKFTPLTQDSKNAVRKGVKRLCRLFERIDQGIHKINVVEDEGETNHFTNKIVMLNCLIQIFRYNWFRTRLF